MQNQRTYVDAVLLVVDKEPQIPEEIRKLTAKHFPNCRLLSAASCNEALEMASECELDFILLDIEMQRMSGIDLCKKFKAAKNNSWVPIILMANSSTSRELKESALKAGADDFIAKPIDKVELLARIKFLLQARSAEHDLRITKARMRELVIQKTNALLQSMEAEKRLNSIIKTIPDIIYRLDRNGIITFISNTIENYGYSAGETIGRNIFEIVHPEDRDKVLYKINERRTGKRNTKSFEVRLLAGDKLATGPEAERDEAVFLIAAEGIYGADPPQEKNFLGTQGIARDITERKRMEKSLNSVVETSVGCIGQTFFDKAVKTVCDLLNVDSAFIGQLIDDTTVKVLSSYCDGQHVVKEDFPIAGTPCNCTIAENSMTVLSDKVSKLFPDAREIRKIGAESYIGLPLLDQNRKPLGVFCALSRRKANLPPQAEEFFSIIAARTSAEIERIRAEDKLREKELFERSIIVLANAIEARDKYTRGHTERVTAYVQAIAGKLHWKPRDMELIYIGTLLHDIGKIGIPDAILNKPGRLTVEEFELMKSHVLIGVKIIQDVPQLKVTINNIRSHHERFDGNGYPFGLKEKKIPIEGRIIAVADSFDAMTSNRPYRKRFSVQEAIAELRKCSGTQFDPKIVDIFCDLLESRELDTGLETDQSLELIPTKKIEASYSL